MENQNLSDLDKMLEAKKRMTPKDGANLVGVDTFEMPGDELYLVGHFATAADAEAAKAKRLEDDPDQVLHVYLPDET